MKTAEVMKPATEPEVEFESSVAGRFRQDLYYRLADQEAGAQEIELAGCGPYPGGTSFVAESLAILVSR